MGKISLISKLFERFRRSERGAALVEFALVAPPLFLLVIGMFEVAMLMFIDVSVEGGLKEAARWGITGQPSTDPSLTREQQIVKIIEANTYGLVQLTDANVSLKVYQSFTDVGKPEPWTDNPPYNGKYDEGEAYDDVNGDGEWSEDQGIAGAGTFGDVVEYTVHYTWGLMTPFIGRLMGQDGVMHLSASVVVRNEPNGSVWETLPGG
jgi:Flp pilus assembly pilin Flp